MGWAVREWVPFELEIHVICEDLEASGVIVLGIEES